MTSGIPAVSCTHSIVNHGVLFEVVDDYTSVSFKVRKVLTNIIILLFPLKLRKFLQKYLMCIPF